MPWVIGVECVLRTLGGYLQQLASFIAHGHLAILLTHLHSQDRLLLQAEL